jgi:hypothetical protein
MASPSNVIAVPKPSAEAYKPDRPLERNALVKAQVKHFHAVEQNLPAELHTGISVADVKTESQASAYIRKVTEALHKHGGRGGRVHSAR